MPIAVIVDWYGPYNDYKAFKSDASWYEKGSKVIYMGVKNFDDGTDMASVDYIGLSTSAATRFSQHHKLRDAKLDAYYLSEISSAGIPGRRSKKTSPDLDAAEGALIAMLQPKLNERRKSPPGDCVVVYSRFFEVAAPCNPAPTPVWFPPLVAYNSWSGEWTK